MRTTCESCSSTLALVFHSRPIEIYENFFTLYFYSPRTNIFIRSFNDHIIRENNNNNNVNRYNNIILLKDEFETMEIVLSMNTYDTFV